MSRRLKIGCAALGLLTALAVVIPLKLLRARALAVDAEKAIRADIEETVSAVPVAGQPAGIVKPDEVKVIPKVGGELKSVLVEEGDLVRQGQILAYLDWRSVDADLRQAREMTAAARARAAQAAADLTAAPVRTQTAVDEARAAVAQAEAAYRTTLRGARREEIERARQVVVQAQKDQDDAEATLATVQRGARPEEIAGAEAGLRQAEAAAEAARVSLDLMKAGPRPEEVARAQAALDEADSTLALRRKELESQQALAQGGYVSANALRAAQAAFDSAQAARTSAAQQLSLTERPYRPEEIAKAEASLRQADAQVEQSRQNLALLRKKTTPEDLASARARRDAAAARLQAARADLSLAEHRTTPEDLDSATAAVRSQRAAARRADAERVVVRQRELEVAALEAETRRAAAALEQAAERAGYTTITAPIDGLVTQVNRKEGEYVQGGQVPLPTAEMALLIVTSTRRLWIEANIDEADIGKVKPGQPATILLRGGGKATARVHRLSPSVRLVQGDVRTFAVKLAVSGPTHSLRSGMSVDVDIVVRQKKGCLSVPSFAIFEDKQQKQFVYVVAAGRASKRAVTKGTEGIERTEILTGLKDGEMVITSLEEKGLRDGAHVKVRPPAEKKPEKAATPPPTDGKKDTGDRSSRVRASHALV